MSDDDDCVEVVMPMAPDEASIAVESLGSHARHPKSGLPSHAYTRNYYCNSCAFSTIKSKVFLYHQVDTHGINFKIFSCDKCDYASKWKCKVIRHRRMIHNIDNPKFEPHMHCKGDSLQSTSFGTTSEHCKQNLSPGSLSPSGCNKADDLCREKAKESTFFQSATSPGRPRHFLDSHAHPQHSHAKEPSCFTREEPAASAGSSSRSRRKPSVVRHIQASVAAANGSGSSSTTPLVLIDSDDNDDSAEDESAYVTDSSADAGEVLPGSHAIDSAAYNSHQSHSAAAPTRYHCRTAVASASCDDSVQAVHSGISAGSITPDSHLKDDSLTRSYSAASAACDSKEQFPAAGTATNKDKSKIVHVAEVSVNGATQFCCQRCAFMSPLRWKVTKHYRLCHWASKRYACPFCPFATTSRVEFFKHKVQHSSKAVHKCHECNYVSSSKTNLYRHLANHRQAHPLKCLYCSFSSTGVAAVQRHMAEHHVSQMQSLDDGSSPSSGSAELVQDDETEEKPMDLIGSVDGEQHQRQDDSQDDKATNDYPIACGACGHETRTIAAMKVHVTEVHRRPSAAVSAAMVAASLSTGVQAFRRPVERDSPRHPHNANGGYSQSSRPSSFAAHPNTSSSATPAFSGEERILSFPSAASRKRQLRPPVSFSSHAAPISHTNISGSGDEMGIEREVKRKRDSLQPDDARTPSPPPLFAVEGVGCDSNDNGESLQCSVCMYVAKWPSDLRRHIKVHTAERRYTCPQCSRCYKYQGDLNVHLRRAHAISELVGVAHDSPEKPAAMSAGSRKLNDEDDTHRNETRSSPSKCGSASMSLQQSSAFDTDPQTLQPACPPAVTTVGTETAAPQSDKPACTLSLKQQESSTLASEFAESDTVVTSCREQPQSRLRPNASITNSAAAASDEQSQPCLESAGDMRCPSCPYTTTSKSRLDVHMRTHAFHKPFRCLFCGYSSYWRGDTKKHIEKHHARQLTSGVNPYSLIERAFEEDLRRADLKRRHRSIANEADTATLEDEVSPTVEADAVHSGRREVRQVPRKPSRQLPADVTGGAPAAKGPLDCPRCSYRAMSAQRLGVHVAAHDDLKIFKCPLCSLRANWKWHIQRHMHREHPDCTLPVEDVRQEEQQAASAAVAVDSGSASSIRQSREHKSTAEPSETGSVEMTESVTSPGTGLRPYRCSLCDRRSNWRSDLRKHFQQAHPSVSDVEIIVLSQEELLQLGASKVDIAQYYPGGGKHRTRPKAVRGVPEDYNDRPFSCSACGKRSCWKSNATKHIRLLHPGVDAHVVVHHKKLQQALANRKSAKSGSASATLRSSGSSSLTASACSTAQAGKNALVRVGGKANQGSFQCSVCSQFSEFMWVIHRHIRAVHSSIASARVVDVTRESQGPVNDARPYICSLCGKRSNWKWDVKKHLLTVHRGHRGSILDEALVKETVISSTGLITELNSDSQAKIDGILTRIREACRKASLGGSELHDTDEQESATPTTPALEEPASKVSSSRHMPATSAASQSSGISSSRSKARQAVASSSPLLSRKSSTTPAVQKVASPTAPAQATRLWQCALCDHKQDWVRLVAHIQAKHNGTNAYQCKACNFNCDTELNIVRHVRAKHGNDSDTASHHKLWVCNIVYVSDQGNETHKALDNKERGKQQSCASRASLENERSPEASAQHAADFFYRCTLCDMKTTWRSAVIRHLKERHDAEFVKKKGRALDDLIVLEKIQKKRNKNQGASSSHDTGMGTASTKRFQCSLCPYRTDKVGMFAEHTLRHRQRPGDVYKCKHCDYWVCAQRLLHQHLKLHNSNATADDCALEHSEPGGEQEDNSQASEKSASGSGTTEGAAAPRRVSSFYALHGGKGDSSGSKERSLRPQPASRPSPWPERPGRCSSLSSSSERSSTMTTASSIAVTKPPPRHQHAALQVTGQSSPPGLQGRDEPRVARRARGSQPDAKSKEAPRYTVSVRRFQCKDCPYRAKATTDLLYHKQFHRPKTSATFKCTKCRYWVCRSGLLKQHMKVHETDYNLRFPLASEARADERQRQQLQQDASLAKTLTVTSLPATGNGRGSSGSEARQLSQVGSRTSQLASAVDVAEFKQRLIASRVQPVILLLSPPQLAESQASGSAERWQASNTSTGSSSGVSLRKLHTCGSCPYATPQAALLKAHEARHGGDSRKNSSDREQLAPSASSPANGTTASSLNCKFCDYLCDTREALRRHARVHSLQYEGDVDEVCAGDANVSPENDAVLSIAANAQPVAAGAGFTLKYGTSSREYILERSVSGPGSRRFGCERCPYASSRKEHFQRHLSLHGSRQRYVCSYCDYSVPVFNLLGQHEQLHVAANSNLLACQSVGNLALLPPVPADVALEQAIVDGGGQRPVEDVHDSLELYENKASDAVEPLDDVAATGKKLYRCDRCPYANVRKDHLVTHLKFHMTKSELQCPYCDYSVSKTNMLTQHVKSHFSSNAQMSVFSGVEGLDGSDGSSTVAPAQLLNPATAEPEFVDISEIENKNSTESVGTAVGCAYASACTQPSVDGYVCQYCERCFIAADVLSEHEMLHLVGISN